MTALEPNEAVELIERLALTPTDLVVEVGSGDGAFLTSLRKRGPRVLGVETERRRVVEAFCNGIDTIWGELTLAVAANIRQRYGLARLVIVRSDATSEIMAAAYSCITTNGLVLTGNVPEHSIKRQRAA